jgi:hypothetical protein
MSHQFHHTEILCSAHNAFVRFVWISEQTAITSLYSINLSVFITEAECLLRGTDLVFKSDSYSFVLKKLMFCSLQMKILQQVSLQDSVSILSRPGHLPLPMLGSYISPRQQYHTMAMALESFLS